MEIFKEISPLKAFLKDVRKAGKTIGLVPTMGALHRGHLSLIDASKASNDVTISTVFVNPTQFNNPNDLLQYPRTLDKDTEMLKEVRCDVLFAPEISELYPSPSTLRLDFGALDKVMEGQFRPGHFSGVGLVVSKLFNIIQPDSAYFGQKDWQQFAVISKLVEELNFPLTLHSVATLREPDGLALSSRNLRLSSEQRKVATVFYRALQLAQRELQSRIDINVVKRKVKDLVEHERDVKLEYFELADSKNLNVLEHVDKANQPILCIAGFVGEVRLIDNLFLFPINE
jgi:pantoate--beta-alanine ligase